MKSKGEIVEGRPATVFLILHLCDWIKSGKRMTLEEVESKFRP